MNTSTLYTSRSLAAGARPQRTAAPGPLAALFGTVRLWTQRARGRRDLRTALHLQRTVGGTALWKDLAVSPGELRDEASKPFWRA